MYESEPNHIKDGKKIWNLCLEIIKGTISPLSYDRWFTPIKPVKLLGSVLTIEVPNKMYFEWIETHYLHALKKSITLILGSKGKLAYAIKNNNSHPYSTTYRSKYTKKKPIQNNSLFNQEYSRNGYKPIVPYQYKESSPIDSNLTFNNFIEGSCNKVARSAAIEIAEKPGITPFNPFVIYSSTGLGKTHLAQAIANSIKKNFNGKKICYISSEEFTSHFLHALRRGSLQDFTTNHLKTDIMIVEDIQFLMKKEKTQEGFFHIFNTLHQNGKQIIITSDRPPKSIKKST